MANINADFLHADEQMSEPVSTMRSEVDANSAASYYASIRTAAARRRQNAATGSVAGTGTVTPEANSTGTGYNPIDRCVVAELARASGYSDDTAYQSAAARTGISVRAYSEGLYNAYIQAGGDPDSEQAVFLRSIADNPAYDSLMVDRIQQVNLAGGQATLLGVSDGQGNGVVGVSTDVSVSSYCSTAGDYNADEQRLAAALTQMSEGYTQFDVIGIGQGGDAAVVAAMQQNASVASRMGEIVTVNSEGLPHRFVQNHAEDAERIAARTTNYRPASSHNAATDAASFLAAGGASFIGNEAYVPAANGNVSDESWMNWGVNEDGAFVEGDRPLSGSGTGSSGGGGGGSSADNYYDDAGSSGGSSGSGGGGGGGGGGSGGGYADDASGDTSDSSHSSGGGGDGGGGGSYADDNSGDTSDSGHSSGGGGGGGGGGNYADDTSGETGDPDHPSGGGGGGDSGDYADDNSGGTGDSDHPSGGGGSGGDDYSDDNSGDVGESDNPSLNEDSDIGSDETVNQGENSSENGGSGGGSNSNNGGSGGGGNDYYDDRSSGSGGNSDSGKGGGSGGSPTEIEYVSQPVLDCAMDLIQVAKELSTLQSTMENKLSVAGRVWSCNSSTSVRSEVQKVVKAVMPTSSDYMDNTAKRLCRTDENYKKAEEAIKDANESVASAFA